MSADLGWFNAKDKRMVRALLLRRNMDGIIPFRFSKIGGFWTRKGDVEIDIVAINEEERKVLFGECKLKGSKFTRSDVERLKEKAVHVKWKMGKRKEYFALFSMDAISETQKKSLEKDGVLSFEIKGLLKR
jgi:hypothetical protein